MCVKIPYAPIFNYENHTHNFSPQNTEKRHLNSIVKIITLHYGNGAT
jgi:hypothetical protein